MLEKWSMVPMPISALKRHLVNELHNGLQVLVSHEVVRHLE